MSFWHLLKKKKKSTKEKYFLRLLFSQKINYEGLSRIQEIRLDYKLFH
jgi:hypothetical protein